MEMDSLDLYLGRTLKKELSFVAPPRRVRPALLARAACWQQWVQNNALYRVHVYCGTGWCEQVDDLFVAGFAEFRLQNHLRMVA